LFISIRSGASVSQLLALKLGSVRRADDAGIVETLGNHILFRKPVSSGIQSGRLLDVQVRLHAGALASRAESARASAAAAMSGER